MDELDLIKQFNPSFGPVPSAAAWQKARSAIDRELARGPHRGDRVRMTWLIRHGRSSAIAIAGVVLAVGLILITTVPGRETSAAASTLRHLAAVAGGTPALTPGPGQYLYTEEIVTTSGGFSGNVTPSGLSGPPVQNYFTGEQEVQTWANAAGQGRTVEGEQMNSTFLTPGDGSLKVPTVFRPEDEPYESDPLSYPNNLAIASSDQNPDTLVAAISKAAGWPGPATPAALFGVVQFGLMVGQSGAFRAAIFNMISTLPGVTALGSVTDDLGRPGLGFGMSLPNGQTTGEQEQLIFDPTTSAPLEFRIVQVSPNTDFGSSCHTNGPLPTGPGTDPCPSTTLPPAPSSPNPPLGSVLGGVEFVSTGLTSTTTATPSGEQVPYCNFGGPISEQEICEPS